MDLLMRADLLRLPRFTHIFQFFHEKRKKALEQTTKTHYAGKALTRTRAAYSAVSG
jgi:hypothetical protein